MTVPIHLHPAAPLAPRVLLPGDPGRALLLAQSLLDAPKMFNHNRGLWGYTGQPEVGELLVATEAIGADGTSRALGVTDRVPASPALVDALIEATGARSGPIASTDLFYDDPRDPEPGWIDAGALAVEMESSTLFALAQRRGLEAGTLLVVTDLLAGERVRIDAEALRAAEHHLGEAALLGLTRLARAAGQSQ